MMALLVVDYLGCLSTHELEVEFLVRLINSAAGDAKKVLIQRIECEISGAVPRPVNSHVNRNPELELETCTLKSKEFIKLVDQLVLDPRVADAICAAAKCQHWLERAKRLKNSFSHLKVDDIITSLHRCNKSFLKTVAWLESQKVRTNQPTIIPNSNSSPVQGNSTIPKQTESVYQKIDNVSGTHHKQSIAPDNNLIEKIDALNEEELVNLTNAIQSSLLNRTKLNASNTSYLATATKPPVKDPNDLDHPSNFPQGNLGQCNVAMIDGPLTHLDRLSNIFNPVGTQTTTVSWALPPHQPLVQARSLPQHSEPIPRNVQQSQAFSCNPNLNVDEYQQNFGSGFRTRPQDYNTRRKWNIEFNGTSSMNVQDFVYRLQTMAIDDDFPINDLTRVLHLYLSGKATDWYWIFKQNNPLASWKQMREAMVSFFCGYETDSDIRDQIKRRMQGHKENFSEFTLEMMKMNSRLQVRLSEGEMLTCLSQNMHPALRNATFAHQSMIGSIEGLRVLCQGFEKLWSTTGYDPRKLCEVPHRRPNFVHEVTYEGMSNLKSVENPSFGVQPGRNSNSDQLQPSSVGISNVSVNPVDSRYSKDIPPLASYNRDEIWYDPNYNQTNPTFDVNIAAINRVSDSKLSDYLICWNCRDMGHRYQDCNQALLHEFCFGCGSPNIRKPNCMKCQSKMSGNGRPNVNYVRGPRSDQNTMNPNMLTEHNSSPNPSSKHHPQSQ